MERGLEERVLREAVGKGLIREEEIQDLQTSQGGQSSQAWGGRLSQLIRSGRLTEGTVAGLVRAIDLEPHVPAGETPIGARPMTPGFSPVDALTAEMDVASGAGAEASAAGDGSHSDDRPRTGKFGKYDIGVLLGEGGMGQVYKAYDKVLGRPVALKFLLGDNPKFVIRLLREARAQAQVEHEHICKVYEVGTIEGRPYIAMQFIAGRTLQDAREEMTLDQRVRVMKEVADAIQAAHSTGLIHRDLKPSNILVQQTDEGQWKPYVMDFGLAREMQEPGLTATGAVLGTVAYMAPEQAAGDVHLLDRRTDVYGMGATLYHSLLGRPPFAGASGLTLLMRVIEGEVAPVRNVDPGMPADLDTIVMKCLEKEPQRRYESAKAVADDLQRYLDGEPILARRSNMAYRIAKWIRKNRAIAAVAAAATVLVVASAALGISSWLSSARRARMAQQFGQEVERIDSMVRISSLVPPHDIRSEKAIVREAMSQIEDEMRGMGSVAVGPGNYALGRGYLALQDYLKAQPCLESAWKSGYQEPVVAYAIGLTLGKRYQQELDLLESIRNKDLREARKKEIEKEYRDPAISYLSRSRGINIVAPEYPEGLIAFYEKKYAVALEKARSACARRPWLYEAKILEADIRTAMANEKRDAGDYAGAMSSYEEAATALRDATRIGGSDPQGHLAFAGVWAEMMFMAIHGTAPDFDSYAKNAISACEMALTVDPNNADAYYKLSLLHRLMAEYAMRQGGDSLGPLTKALQAGQRMQELRPQDPMSWYVLATVWHQLALLDSQTGKDPRAGFGHAIEALEKSLQLRPDFGSALNSLGITYLYKGQYEMGHGLDARQSLNAAVAHFERSIRLNREFTFAYTNLCAALASRAEYELGHGIDPRSSLEEARQVSEKGLVMNPNFPDLLSNAGLSSHYMAQYQVSRGQDPRPSATEALRCYQRALDVNPNLIQSIINSADVLRLVAQFESLHGEDPTAALSEARRKIDTVVTSSIYEVQRCQELALLSQVEAEHALRKGARAEPPLADARKWLKRVVSIDGGFSPAYELLGAVELLDARWRMRIGRLPDESFAAARTALEKAVSLDPGDAEAYRLLAETDLRSVESRSGKVKHVEQEIDRALQMMDKSLAINPQKAEALAVKGGLLLMRARALTDTGTRAESARAAVAALEQAFQVNPLLEKEFGERLQEARILAK